MKPTTTLFLSAGTSLAVLHFLSLKFFLYWQVAWLDIPMHALGGVVVALGYLSLRDLFPSWPIKYFSAYHALGFVVVSALVWEVFEVLIGVAFDENRYVADTTLDLIMGLMGGAAGYYVGKQMKQLEHE